MLPNPGRAHARRCRLQDRHLQRLGIDETITTLGPDAGVPAERASVSEVGVITVSRQFGAGGSDLARALGRLLGWRVVDKQVVRRLADELRVPFREAEARDEHVPSLAERIGRLLAGSLPEVMVTPVVPTDVDESEIASLADAILREAASSPPVVLVGHGGMCLFRDRDDALHVRVEAPFEHRVRQVARRMGFDEARARDEVEARDEGREHYIRSRFGRRAGDSSLYALVLNSARVPPDQGARVIRALLEGGGPLRPPASRPG